MGLQPTELYWGAGRRLDSRREKELLWGSTILTAHLRINALVSFIRLTGERVTHVSELSATEIALDRKITTSVKVLYAKVRPSSRNVQIEFTISRQLASSLREEIEKARQVWVDDIYPDERVMAGHRDKTRGAPAPAVNEPWSSTVLCVLPCRRGYTAQDRSLDKAQRPSGVEGPVAKGVVVTVGRGHLVARSEICGPEARGWIHSTNAKVPVQGSIGECRERACTPPFLPGARRSMLGPRLCPTLDPVFPTWLRETVAVQVFGGVLDIRVTRSRQCALSGQLST